MNKNNALVITRIFDAPRKLVWQAWTQAQHLEQWWGPQGFRTKVVELDLRSGGKTHYVMIGPDGTEYPVEGVFSEIVAPERIVTTDEFGEGFEVPSDDDLPKGIVLTVRFEDLAGKKTKLTLQMTHASPEDREKHEKMGVVAGWHSSFNCLDEYLVQTTKGKAS